MSLDELLDHWVPAPPGTPAAQRVKVQPQTALFIHLARLGDDQALSLFISTKHPSVRPGTPTVGRRLTQKILRKNLHPDRHS